jgi:hypothetical protein
VEEKRFSELVGFLLPGMRAACGELHAARLAGNIGREVLHFGGLVLVAEYALGRLFGAAPLQRGHAVEQTRFEVHHPVGILEVARQPRVGALHHPRTEAQITFFQ